MDIDCMETIRLYDTSLDIATYGMMIIGTLWWTANNSLYNLVAGMFFLGFACIIALINFRRKSNIIRGMKIRLIKEHREWMKKNMQKKERSQKK